MNKLKIDYPCDINIMYFSPLFFRLCKNPKAIHVLIKFIRNIISLYLTYFVKLSKILLSSPIYQFKKMSRSDTSRNTGMFKRSM